MASSFLQDATIGSLHDRLKEKRKIELQPAARSEYKKGRHVKWQVDNYELIKQGKPIASTKQIEELFSSGQLVDESHFCIYRHVNYKLMERNQNVPVYEAVYWLANEERFVKVQKCHLKHAYAVLGKNNVQLAYTVEEDGVPYWVDRFLYSKIK